MKRTDLIEKMSEVSGVTKKDTERVFAAFIDVVKEAMAREEEVVITGFGKFSVKERAEKAGRNPKTGEEIVIPAKKVVKFKAGKTLQSTVE